MKRAVTSSAFREHKEPPGEESALLEWVREDVPEAIETNDMGRGLVDVGYGGGSRRRTTDEAVGARGVGVPAACVVTSTGMVGDGTLEKAVSIALLATLLIGFSANGGHTGGPHRPVFSWRA